jgi:hypothetical protein
MNEPEAAPASSETARRARAPAAAPIESGRAVRMVAASGPIIRSFRKPARKQAPSDQGEVAIHPAGLVLTEWKPKTISGRGRERARPLGNYWETRAEGARGARRGESRVVQTEDPHRASRAWDPTGRSLPAEGKQGRDLEDAHPRSGRTRPLHATCGRAFRAGPTYGRRPARQPRHSGSLLTDKKLLKLPLVRPKWKMQRPIRTNRGNACAYEDCSSRFFPAFS